MSERYVHLVRHGRPQVDVDTAASQWRLDPSGLDAVQALRASSRLPDRAVWFTSPEPKARETATLLTDGPVEVVDGLRDQVRLQVGWIDDFDLVVRAAYAEPDKPAHEGWEPLASTRTRAADAVRRLLREHPRGDLVLVGHGTTLSLVAAELTGTEPNPGTATAMGFPDVVTIRLSTTGDAAPLSFRQVLLGAAAVAAGDVVVWELVREVGWVLVPAGVVSAMVAVPRGTRDLGITLLAAVLLALVITTFALVFLAKLPSGPGL